MSRGRVIYNCPHALCTTPLYTGECRQDCLDRYYGKASDTAKWKHRAEHNDFIFAECSNCGFMEEAWKVVKKGGDDRTYIKAKWKYCPMCGKPMEV